MSADGGTTWVDATVGPGSSWSASGVTLSAGAGTLSVRSIDAANNTTAGTGHSYTLDATPPSETFPTVTLTSDTGCLEHRLHHQQWRGALCRHGCRHWRRRDCQRAGV